MGKIREERGEHAEVDEGLGMVVRKPKRCVPRQRAARLLRRAITAAGRHEREREEGLATKPPPREALAAACCRGRVAGEKIDGGGGALE
jgi:hypothetical protein